MTKQTEPKHTPKAEALAEAVLKAAGSGLRHYSLPKTRAAIFAAAQEGIDAAVASASTPEPGFLVHEYLAAQREIAVVWAVDDVLEVRPDLTPDQAWEVLKMVKKSHDCESGITWDHLSATAAALFPQGEAA